MRPVRMRDRGNEKRQAGAPRITPNSWDLVAVLRPFSYALCVYAFWIPVVLANNSQASQQFAVNELLRMDLRQLMDLEISLASRKIEKQIAAPAAVYVVTREDIRRSGRRRLPELLRLVPGLHVAKIDANKWAVSIRNGQSRFSSTMLVMVDGRPIFTPFFAGVYWESQSAFIEDINRIEIVRGPGGPLWGANAVDGVINIVTETAARTQGVLTYGLGGSGELEQDAGFRYGGKTANGLSYRIFARAFKINNGEYLGLVESTNNRLATIGAPANDAGNTKTLGFRMDWGVARDTFMLQGNSTIAENNEDRVVGGMLRANSLSSDAYSLLMNWERKFASGDSLVVKAFYDEIQRRDDILQNQEKTLDFDLQHNMERAHHSMAWGLGLRYYDNIAEISDPSRCGFSSPCFGVDPAARTLRKFSAFAQDRIELSKDFSLILGSKFEHNDFTGFEYQPTMRGLWEPGEDTTYWAAISRTVTTPNRVNTDGFLDFGSFSFPIGRPGRDSRVNITYELGFRKLFSSRLALDSTLFFNEFLDLPRSVGGPNTDELYGSETNLRFEPNSTVRLELGYTYNIGRRDSVAGLREAVPVLPMHTGYLKAYFDIAKNLDLDASLQFVSPSLTTNSSNLKIPAYSVANVRMEWRPSRRMSLSMLLSNFLGDAHAEAFDTVKINTGIRPGLMLKLSYMPGR